MPTLAYNKKANFDYTIKETFTAGMVLKGYEVKSIKTGHISLKGAFVTLKSHSKEASPELLLVNAHIPLYKHAGTIPGHNPERPIKLLITKKEITQLIGKKKSQGLTLVPIKVYTKKRLLKLEFGIGQGKKKYDKREDIKKKDIDRKIRTLTKTKTKAT